MYLMHFDEGFSGFCGGGQKICKFLLNCHKFTNYISKLNTVFRQCVHFTNYISDLLHLLQNLQIIFKRAKKGFFASPSFTLHRLYHWIIGKLRKVKIDEYYEYR